MCSPSLINDYLRVNDIDVDMIRARLINMTVSTFNNSDHGVYSTTKGLK